MRISYVHSQHSDWYGAIRTWSKQEPTIYWAITDQENVPFLDFEKAKRFMKRKRYIVDKREQEIANLLEIFPEENRHVA